METWYKTRFSRFSLRTEVEPVELDRVNDKSVWINGRRLARVSDYEQYHRTELDALTFLRERIARRVAWLNQDLQEARSALGQVESALKKLPAC